ncbi:hypothetical protein MHYP_G00179480 [Metynnis hypsauchen]
MNARGSSPSTNVLQDCCEPSLPSQLSHSLQSSTIHKSHVSNLACKYQTIVNSQFRTEVRIPLVLQREQSLKIFPPLYPPETWMRLSHLLYETKFLFSS